MLLYHIDNIYLVLEIAFCVLFGSLLGKCILLLLFQTKFSKSLFSNGMFFLNNVVKCKVIEIISFFIDLFQSTKNSRKKYTNMRFIYLLIVVVVTMAM